MNYEIAAMKDADRLHSNALNIYNVFRVSCMPSWDASEKLVKSLITGVRLSMRQ